MSALPLEPFDPKLTPEARELALALEAVLMARPVSDSTCVTAALVELTAWWVRREAMLLDARPSSILLATIELLIQRTAPFTERGHG